MDRLSTILNLQWSDNTGQYEAFVEDYKGRILRSVEYGSGKFVYTVTVYENGNLVFRSASDDWKMYSLERAKRIAEWVIGGELYGKVYEKFYGMAGSP